MRRGSVTVTFSIVAMILLSFVISFFEMAAYTARNSYHASAGLLAVENYFAAYLEPLYSEYHIFGREVPEGKDILEWTEETIAGDVLYMTKKEEGQRSLLLRAGADFSVSGADVLTGNKGEGFYLQAVTAMKYRGILEVKELVEQFMGVTKQADTHLQVASAKAATDQAYALVEEKLLELMEQVDGVRISKYEQFLRGKATVFQTDTYVKFLTTDKAGAAAYFDRTEVYQAFLQSSVNHIEQLDSLIKAVENLAGRVKEREEKEIECRKRLEEVLVETEMVSQGILKLREAMDSASQQLAAIQAQFSALRAQEDVTEEQLNILSENEAQVAEALEGMSEEFEQLKEHQMELIEEKVRLDKELAELEKLKKEQEKEAEDLERTEKAFLALCDAVENDCDAACGQVEEIKAELETAKKVKKKCESILDAAELLLGRESTEEYRRELEKYQFYESAEGYDFDLMKQTVRANAEMLRGTSVCFCGRDAASLMAAAAALRSEQEGLRGYSFEGLKLDYGEMSLEENRYETLGDEIAGRLNQGFLGFLTRKEVSGKELDKSCLPSGFRYEGKENQSLFSILNLNVGSIFEEMRAMLPETVSFENALKATADAVLFHSYLNSHFSDYTEAEEGGALSYEKEYLIAGKARDADNLAVVSMRICILRTALQFISLYSDGVRKAQAEQAAAAVCGVIGLPALISVVTFVLLLVWAVEEAVIDTSALLQGKKLSLYPGKSGGSLSFPEILIFSKQTVYSRAAAKKNAGNAGVGYGAYVQLYLLMTKEEDKKYRAMDLIQENLRICYQNSFRMNRCVWRISYETDGREYFYAYDW